MAKKKYKARIRNTKTNVYVDYYTSSRAELLRRYDNWIALHKEKYESGLLTIELYYKLGKKYIYFQKSDYEYCRICSRKLLDPRSVMRKIGPVCWSKQTRCGWGHPSLELYKPNPLPTTQLCGIKLPVVIAHIEEEQKEVFEIKKHIKVDLMSCLKNL